MVLFMDISLADVFDSYTLWTLILAVLWLVAYIPRRHFIKRMLFMSLILLPFGLTQPYFVPGYWHASVREQFETVTDIGSFLWIFFLGGIVAVLFEEVFKLRFKKPEQLSQTQKTHAITIYILLLISGIVASSVSYFTQLSVVRGALIIGLVILWYVVWNERKILREVLYGASLFGALYLMTLLFVDWLFPEFTSTHLQLTQGTSLGYVFTIPLEEYVYAIVFGAATIPVYQGIRNSEIVAKKKKTPKKGSS